MADSPTPRTGSTGEYRGPSFGGCPYCERRRVLWFTGRRWICRECWREHLGGEPDA